MLWGRLMDGLRAAMLQGTPGPSGTSLVWHSADPLTEQPFTHELPLHPVCAQTLCLKAPPATQGSPRSLSVCHLPAPPELPSATLLPRCHCSLLSRGILVSRCPGVPVPAVPVPHLPGVTVCPNMSRCILVCLTVPLCPCVLRCHGASRCISLSRYPPVSPCIPVYPRVCRCLSRYPAVSW